MTIAKLIDAIADKVGEHELYLSDLENKVKAGEASENTLRTQRQQRNEKMRLLRIIKALTECIVHGEPMSDELVEAISSEVRPAGTKVGIVLEAGMSLMDVLAKYPNATMEKIQKACARQGMSIGADMVIR